MGLGPPKNKPTSCRITLRQTLCTLLSANSATVEVVDDTKYSTCLRQLTVISMEAHPGATLPNAFRLLLLLVALLRY